MTSQEIKARGLKVNEAWELPFTEWLKEIAYQIAASREEAKKWHEENLQQRDEFLTGEPPKRGPIASALGIDYPFTLDATSGLEPPYNPPKRDDGPNPNRTAAALRSCALTILENQMSPAHASDYLNSYADAVVSHENARESLSHPERIYPHGWRCPTCTCFYFDGDPRANLPKPGTDTPDNPPASQPQWTEDGPIKERP